MMVFLLVITFSFSVFSDNSVSSSEELPLPENGKVQIFTKDEQIAPLEIETPEGQYYFIKMVDTKTGKTVLNIFVHGGQDVVLNVPLGTYELKYASGEKWYGYEVLFGEDTAYNKVEDFFEFKIKNDYVYGYTLTLYNVEHGNLVTTPINPADF